MASKTNIAIVHATLPLVEANSEKIMATFLHDFFHDNPEMKKYCNMSLHKENSGQPKVIAEAVVNYAKNVNNKEALESMFHEISNIHVGLNVEPYMYPLLGTSLLGAVKKVLGFIATPKILAAWEENYLDLADILIKREKEMYEEKANQPGGWTGKRSFRVTKKVKECENVMSLYFTPTDGGILPEFKAGQYVTIGFDVEGESHLNTRHYSLSDCSGKDYFRISVKREDGDENKLKGIASNYIHNDIQEGTILDLAMPAGIFTLKKQKGPIVLLSAGVGITPLMSMYNQLIEEKIEEEVIFIHSTRNSETHTFKEEIKKAKQPNFHRKIMYTQPLEGDILSVDYDYIGYLNEEILFSSLSNKQKATYYICGSKSFMKSTFQILRDHNISMNNVNYEFFGSTKEFTEVTGVSKFSSCPVNH